MSKTIDKERERKKDGKVTPFTLCWDCANASGGCSWADELQPVEGWQAYPCVANSRYLPYDSFIVLTCPLFERDAVSGGQDRYLLGKKRKRNGTGNNRKRGSADVKNRMAQSHGSDRVDVRSSRISVRQDESTRDVIELAFGIVEQAVRDWKALDYGRKPEALMDGVTVTRREVVRFFFSEWFLHLIEPFPYTPKQVRKALNIPENALELLDSNDSEERRLKWCSGK